MAIQESGGWPWLWLGGEVRGCTGNSGAFRPVIRHLLPGGKDEYVDVLYNPDEEVFWRLEPARISTSTLKFGEVGLSHSCRRFETTPLPSIGL